MNGRGCFENKISPTVEMTRTCHSDQRDDCMEAGGRAMHGAIAEESCQVAELKISPVAEMTRACHSDQREESCQVAEDKISPAVEMASICHSDQREESCQVAEDKISPNVEMTNVCHFDQRGRLHGQIYCSCNICIHHLHVDYAGGTTPRTGEVELRQERQSRAMQGAIAEESYLTTKLFKYSPYPVYKKT